MNTKTKLLISFLSIMFVAAPVFAQQLQVGDNVADFTLQNLIGDSVSLSDFKGQIVMLTFFATWCAPCVIEMPIIENEIWQVYKDQGVKVLAVDQMESPVFVKDFINAKGITYEAVIDNNGSVTSQYIERLPHNTLIDPEGKIVHTAPGLELNDIKQLIDEMLITSDLQNSHSTQPTSFSMSIFPNPISFSKNKTNITFSLHSPNAKDGILQIFNVLGQQVRQININIAAKGQTNYRFDLRDQNNTILTRGIYFVRFSSGSEKIMKRFVVLE